MTQTQLGNHLGVAARQPISQAVATVVANGGAAALVLGATGWQKLRVGLIIDCYSPTGVLRFTGRTIEYIIQSSGVVAYLGGDVPAVAAGDLVYVTGTRTRTSPSNINGGVTEGRGLTMIRADSILEIDVRLNELNSTYYTLARLDTLTYNDKVYALRLLEEAGSI